MKNGIIINEVSYEAVEDIKDNCLINTIQEGCSVCGIRNSCNKFPLCPCIFFEHGSTTYHFELRK